ncbi:MAG TPA: hypothetical protein ENF20_02380 [Candidatus Marinimicrobia bacterium]|nr:hypothetical protein [Candidatus Neomarinimicrobiota bacterium]
MNKKIYALLVLVIVVTAGYLVYQGSWQGIDPGKERLKREVAALVDEVTGATSPLRASLGESAKEVVGVSFFRDPYGLAISMGQPVTWAEFEHNKPLDILYTESLFAVVCNDTNDNRKIAFGGVGNQIIDSGTLNAVLAEVYTDLLHLPYLAAGEICAVVDLGDGSDKTIGWNVPNIDEVLSQGGEVGERMLFGSVVADMLEEGQELAGVQENNPNVLTEYRISYLASATTVLSSFLPAVDVLETSQYLFESDVVFKLPEDESFGVSGEDGVSIELFGPAFEVIGTYELSPESQEIDPSDAEYVRVYSGSNEEYIVTFGPV